MAEIIPFKGILYNPQKMDATSVVAPPYDIVTPELKETLYSRSPYNIIRIDFGKDKTGDNDKENRYTRASRWLNEWLKREILLQDTAPAFYCYEVTYNPPLPPFTKRGRGGIEKKLRGFLGAVRLEELGKGRIYPHEMTYSKPKADRLNILRFCRANISPIFSLYSSKKSLTSSILKKTARGKALIEARDEDGFMHMLWRISDNTSIEAIKKELSDKDIFIADGHHRYEVALEFRNEMNKLKSQIPSRTSQDKSQILNPWDYVMMFLVNIEDDGLTILPTHRLAKIVSYPDTAIEKKIKESLKPYFDITTINFDASTEVQARQKMFRFMQNGKHLLGMFIRGEKAYHVLKFKGIYPEINSHLTLKSIDVTILHKLIFEKLFGINEFEYEMNPESVIEKINNGTFHVAFFLNPTRVQDVRKVALAGQRMPPKSTYFYPKILTGMVIYKFSDESEKSYCCSPCKSHKNRWEHTYYKRGHRSYC